MRHLSGLPVVGLGLFVFGCATAEPPAPAPVEGLTPEIHTSLGTQVAVKFIESVLQTGDFEQAAAARGRLSVTSCAASSGDA